MHLTPIDGMHYIPSDLRLFQHCAGSLPSHPVRDLQGNSRLSLILMGLESVFELGFSLVGKQNREISRIPVCYGRVEK